MVIKTEMLRCFVEVAQAGNLATAAKNLGRTPSAVSMMLKQFEENLNAPLFKTDRKTNLTPLGKFTLEEAQREIFHFDNTVSSILRYAYSNDGLVRLACLPSGATYMLPDVTRSVQDKIPGVFIDISEAQSDIILQQLREGTVDIGIISEMHIIDTVNFHVEPLIADRFGIVCCADSELGQKETVHWSDLLATNFVDNYLCRAIDEPAVRKATANARLQVASPLALGMFLQTYDGASAAPELACKMLPDTLVFKVPDGKAHYRHVQIVSSKHHEQSKAVRLFIETLHNHTKNIDFARPAR